MVRGVDGRVERCPRTPQGDGQAQFRGDSPHRARPRADLRPRCGGALPDASPLPEPQHQLLRHERPRVRDRRRSRPEAVLGEQAGDLGAGLCDLGPTHGPRATRAGLACATGGRVMYLHSRSTRRRSRSSTTWAAWMLMPRTSAMGWSVASTARGRAGGSGEAMRRSGGFPARSPLTETPCAAAA